MFNNIITDDELKLMTREEILDAVKNKKRIVSLTIKERENIKMILKSRGIEFEFKETEKRFKSSNYKYSGEFILKW